MTFTLPGRFGPEALTDSAGNSLPGSTVSVTPSTGVTATVDAEGNLTIVGPPGAYTAVLTPPGGLPAVPVDIVIPPDPSEVAPVGLIVAEQIERAAGDDALGVAVAGLGTSKASTASVGVLTTRVGAVETGKADAAAVTAALAAKLDTAAATATYLPRWKASTAYTAGQYVLNPSGQVVSALADFTSGTTYSAGNWTTPAAGGVAAVAGLTGSPTAADLEGAGLLRTATARTSFTTRTPNDPVLLRALIRGGQITTSTPLVPRGDSHTDNTSSASAIWTQLSTIENQTGGGLEGVPAAAIVPLGNNGQKLSDYLTGAGTNTLAASEALNPRVTVDCWLTNDVRLGGLGLTVAAITTAGAALLVQLIDASRAINRSTLRILRVPAPYTTVNTGGSNYISDGTTVNPAGLAQVYTDGVRAAYYEAARQRPDVLVYDPQVRLFGTVSPGVAGDPSIGYYANQIHQNGNGYRAEGKDFAAWVAAAPPFSTSRSLTAQLSNPYDPWTVYSRDVEDPTRYTLVESYTLATGSPSTFIDLAPVVGTGVAGVLDKYDILEITAADTTVQIPVTSGIALSGANVRVTGLTVPTNTAPAGTPVRAYRRTASADTAVTAVLRDTSWRFKRAFVISGGGAGFVDLTAASTSAFRATQPASEVATTFAQAGNKLYISGGDAGDVGRAIATFSASGANMRVTGLTGDYSSTSLKGRLVALVGTQADSQAGAAGATGATGPAGGLLSKTLSGYYSSPTNPSAVSTAALINGNEYAVPWIPDKDGTVDRLKIAVTTATASSLMRLGIRVSDANGRPGAVLTNGDGFGTVDTSATGLKETATNPTPAAVTAGTLYWLVGVYQGTGAATVRTLTGMSPLVLTSNSDVSSAAGYFQAPGASGTLGSWTGVQTAASVPWIAARAV